MSLKIQRLASRFHAPRRASDRVCRLIPTLRSDLTSALTQQLAPNWPEPSDLCFIRRLPVRVSITIADLEADRLSTEIARAFAEALAVFMEHGSAVEPGDVVRFKTRSAYLAQFVMDVLAGAAMARWEYEELRELAGRDAVDAIVNLFEREPLELLPVLRELEQDSALDPVLERLGEFGMERLLSVTAPTSPHAAREIEMQDLLKVAGAALALRCSTPGLFTTTRAQALRICLRLAADTEPAGELLTPRQVFKCLKALKLALEQMAGAKIDDRVRPANEQAKVSRGDPVAPRDWTAAWQSRTAAREEGEVPGEAPEPLTPVAGSASLVTADDTISSECAGLFFLARYLLRDGWPTIAFECVAEKSSAALELQFLLAALSLEALGLGREGTQGIDAGVKLFAGWSGLANAAAFREFQSHRAPALCLRMRERLSEGSAPRPEESEPPESSLAWLARRYLQLMQQEIHALRRASRKFLLGNTLGLKGRIRVSMEALDVVLPPAPYHVVLHLAGLDQPVDEVPWQGGRRIRFLLEGL